MLVQLGQNWFRPGANSLGRAVRNFSETFGVSILSATIGLSKAVGNTMTDVQITSPELAFPNVPDS